MGAQRTSRRDAGAPGKPVAAPKRSRSRAEIAIRPPAAPEARAEVQVLDLQARMPRDPGTRIGFLMLGHPPVMDLPHDDEAAREVLALHGLQLAGVAAQDRDPGAELGELVRDAAADPAAVRALIEREVEAVNARMPRVQHVRKFHLLAKELDHDDGEVTATMKVRRKSISQLYAAEIEGLYA